MKCWLLTWGTALMLAVPLPAQEAGELMKQATRALETEDFPRATRLFEQLTRAHPQLLEGWLQLGQLYADVERWDEAQQAFEQALPLSSDRFPLELDLARVERHQHRFQEARARLARLLEARPEHREARLLQAEVLAAEGQTSSALAAYDELLQRQPDSSEAAVARARLLAEDEPERALTELSRLLEHDSSNPQVGVARARIHMDQGQWPEAEQLLATALTTHPDFSQAHLARAQMWQGRGLDDRAEQAYLDGLRWSPQQRQLNRGLRWLRQDHAVTLEPLYSRFQDNAGNRGQGTGARLSFDLDRRNRAWLQFEQRDLSNPNVPRQTVEQVSLGWRGRLSEEWLAQAEVGVSAGRARGGLALGWTPTFEDSLTFSAQRQVLLDTAQLAQNGISLDELGLVYRRRVTARDQLEVGYSRGFFSDNNSRHAYQLGYFHDFQSQGPRVSLGLAARGLSYERVSRSGYFSPPSFHTVQALFRLENRHPDDPWLYALEAGWGQQTGGQSLTSLAASLGYRFSDSFELEASALTSNSALGTAAGFTYHQQSLRMLVRF